MDCLDEEIKEHSMWKKLWPWLLTILISVGISYYLTKNGVQNGTKPDQSSKEAPIPIEESLPPTAETPGVAIIDSCPGPREVIKEVVREVPVVKEVIKWKTRTVEVPIPIQKIVYRDRPLKQGCNVDWGRGIATAAIDSNSNIRCTIDYQRQHVDTKIWSREVAEPFSTDRP